MTEAAARARIEAWLAPISEANPAGEDARYDALHEDIRNEAAKIDSPSAGTTDWEIVLRDSEKLTCTQAKDLLIESYAAFSLFQVEGLLGLAAGLFLLAESMDTFWDVMYPPARRIRARANALNWLTNKLDTTLSEVPIGAGDHDAVDALDAAVKRLRVVVGERFEDAAPALRPLSDTVERLKMSLPARADAPAPADAAPSEDTSDTEPPPPPDAPPDAPPPDAPPPDASAAAPPAEPAAPAEATPDDLYAQLLEAASKWTGPCPGDAPAGIDAKYEIAHEELRGDVAAFDSPAGGDLEWPAAVDRAGGILETLSKDLLIASYLAFALWERDRLEGLAVGLAVIEQICSLYWEDAFPALRRIRGRANALSWLLDRLEVPLPDEPLTAASKVPVAKLVVATKRFTATVRDKFGDAAPSLRPFEDAVKRLEMSVPAPAAKPKPAPAAAKPKTQPAAKAPAAKKPAAASAPVSLAGGEAALADPKETAQFKKQVATSLNKAGIAIRKASMQDPSSYTFARAALLVLLDPPAVEGKTQFRGPQARFRDQLEQLLAAQEWEALLTLSEANFYANPYFFDLHRYSGVSLANLGADFAQAHAAAMAGTAALAVRLECTFGASFGDGGPFCSPATREWITAEVIPSGGGGGGGGGEGAEILAEARALAGSGDRDAAMGLLEGVAHGARSGRARFMARFTMAQTLSSGPTVTVAESLLASLLPEIDAMGLEAWEPELAADCYRAHLACLGQLDKDPHAAERKAMVFQRLCRVDPLGATKAAG